MRRFLSSPRRRRRTFWVGGALIAVSGITFSMIHWSNTSHYREAKIRYDEKAQVAEVPIAAPYARAKREGVLKVAAAFVNSAVRRDHVERSYDLATPSLRTGYSRKQWSTQDIPVQPYPLDFAKYKLKGSFTDSVWLQVAVFPDHKHDAVPAAVFDIVLKPAGSGKSRRWLVDSWTPAGYEGVPSGPLGSTPRSSAAPDEVVEYKSSLDGKWLLLPVSAFALGVLLVLLVGLRGWWRGARAMKRYRSTYE